MIWRNIRSQGPVAYLRFETADGIGAGKTEVRCRSVRVGVVKEVKLADNLKTVVVQVELIPGSDKLLRSDTSFWVVRPRVTASAVSGLDTLITGAYLELNPGPDVGEEVNHFTGLETPPATSRDIPGRRIVLTTEEAGSLSAGSPLYYRGIEVGRIESRQLDITDNYYKGRVNILLQKAQKGTMAKEDWKGVELYSGILKEDSRTGPNSSHRAATQGTEFRYSKQAIGVNPRPKDSKSSNKSP